MTLHLLSHIKINKILKEAAAHISRRDWFAGMALGISAEKGLHQCSTGWAKLAASSAVEIADALIAELGKK